MSTPDSHDMTAGGKARLGLSAVHGCVSHVKVHRNVLANIKMVNMISCIELGIRKKRCFEIDSARGGARFKGLMAFLSAPIGVIF